MDQENFTVLENKAIGRNIAVYRKIRGLKAFDVAEKLGMKEASYTRYERGEAAINVDLIQQVAEILKVDPITMLSVHPSIFIELSSGNGNNSPVGIHGYYNHQTSDDSQTQLVLKVIENVIAVSNKLITLLDKEK